MEKFILKSKTIWGVIIMAAPMLLPMLGLNFGEEEIGLFNAAFDSLITAAGAVLAVIGRWKATDGLKVIP